MAESSSTGTSSTGSTSTGATGNGTTGSTSSTGATSNNGGAAASGSQTSTNGSFSTGNGNNGNGSNEVGPGVSFGAGVGAINGPSIGLPSFNKGKADFTGFASSNFGQGWGGAPTYTVSPGADGKHTIHPDANGKHTIYATTESDRSGSTVRQLTVPFMTVDDVYGKGNQSIVESQGDYEASSNEKSNVETSTFGKQDEISVTPLSVTEDKGLVNNDAIQSIEGLDFQQKDKANQEVMEAKKSRDKAEAEDNADGMRDQLKAVAEKNAEEDNNAFQVAEKDAEKVYNEENAVKQNNLKQLKQELDETNKAFEEAKNAKREADKKVEEAESKYQEAQLNKKQADQYADDLNMRMDQLRENALTGLLDKFGLVDFSSLRNITEMAEAYGIEIGDTSKASVSELKAITKEAANKIKAIHEQRLKTAENELADAQKQQKEVEENQNVLAGKSKELESKYNKAQKDYNTWKTGYWSKVENVNVEEEAAAKKAEEAPTTETPSYKANIEAARNEINNSKDLSDEQKSEAIGVLDNVEAASDAMNKAANDLAANPNDADIAQRYLEETGRYIESLKVAKGNKTLKNTDLNKTFVKAVAAANDFKVTKEDGTQQDYAEFAAEMAMKSPELAKAMYEAKAQKYKEDGHPILAKIETARSKMVMTWLGSKFTFADNQVRNQFNQMAKTDMRATYAAYNNVLNDPNATPDEKAEAFSAINQANTLMTASAALQASTGFLSGIGDGTSDGVYGTTDPGELNGYQEALNTASNFTKVALGLNVTPGANKAYQNMYYLAGAKVNESGLFSKDFDGDGFALCQEYGNNAAVGMIVGAGELATGVALMFNPATLKIGINLTIDSVKTFFDGLYGVQKEVNKSIKYSSEVLSYFNEAKSIVAETGNKEAIGTIDNAVKQIEDFQLKSDEVGNLDNWLEGSGSNTADNGKFNQALSYDEWLKLIEADPVMQEYAKSLNR